jgi:hypothetical protein
LILGKRQGKKDVDETLENIRQRYAVLAASGGVPETAVKAFDDRYYHALKSRIDLKHFLEAESLALDDLESRAAAPDSVPPGVEEDSEGRESFLDRVTRELYERIEGYPSAVLPAGSSFDMEKLAGMLIQFGKDHWPVMEQELRNRHPVSRPEIRMSIESMVFEYCIADGSGLPRFFNRYVQSVQRGREAVYEQEEKRCLAGAAKFLHAMKNEVYTLMTQAEKEESISALKNVEAFIVSAVENFRMKDLRLL